MRRQPTFDFTPPDVSDAGSAEVGFLVTNATISTELDSYTLGGYGEAQNHPPMFRIFARNMASDFEEILVARGYPVRGPFGSFQAIPFPDRDASDLVLTADVRLVPEFEQLTVKEYVGGLDALTTVLGGSRSGPTECLVSGTLEIQARITLRIAESVTNELMWTRSIDLGSVKADLEPSGTYLAQELTLANLLKQKNRFYSDLRAALEDQYTQVMQTAWDFLNPTEMQTVSNQAQKVRDRTVFD